GDRLNLGHRLAVRPAVADKVVDDRLTQGAAKIVPLLLILLVGGNGDPVREDRLEAALQPVEQFPADERRLRLGRRKEHLVAIALAGDRRLAGRRRPAAGQAGGDRLSCRDRLPAAAGGGGYAAAAAGLLARSARAGARTARAAAALRASSERRYAARGRLHVADRDDPCLGRIGAGRVVLVRRAID